MLSTADNELATNTEPGTPMGELFRRFWLPVLLGSELPVADGEPVRVKILSEDLVAFRETDGGVGLVDGYCPHRGAPLFYGRNEESGLRCVYHGWKFDVDGTCVDLPSAPEGEAYKEKIEIISYPCVEAGDLIWTYMGPKDKRPPLPDFEWIHPPKEHRYVSKFQLECNYLQAMEGDYDLSHANFLHSNLTSAGIQNPLVPSSGRSDPFAGADSPPDEPFPRAVGSRRVSKGSVIEGMSRDIEETPSGALFIQPIERPGQPKVVMDAPWMMPIFCTGESRQGVSGRGVVLPSADSRDLAAPGQRKQ